jgi:DNA-binding PadR family transcriptional regulator
VAKAKTIRIKKQDLEGCPCAGHNLDKFIQPAALSVLAAEPLHGYLIVQRLKALPMFQGQAPDLAGVYRFLKAMEDRGLVKCEWDLSQTGPARRVFHITAQGRSCLAKWVATLAEYAGELDDLLGVLRKSARRTK